MTETTRVEDIIINQLIWNPKFFGKSIPFIKTEYFEEVAHISTFNQILKYFNEYNNQIPDVNVLKVLIEDDSSLTEESHSEVISYVNNYCLGNIPTDTDWLNENAEKFCRDRSVYNAIVRSISILEGKDPNMKKDALPELLEDALAVSFDIDIGHDYTEQAEERYEKMHEVNTKYHCSLEAVNKITNGGFEKKTLNVFIGSVGCISSDTKVKVRISVP